MSEQTSTPATRDDLRWDRWRRGIRISAVVVLVGAVAWGLMGRTDTPQDPAAAPTQGVVVPAAPAPSVDPTATSGPTADPTDPDHDHEPDTDLPTGTPTATPDPEAVAASEAASDAAQAALVAWWDATDAETDVMRTKRLERWFAVDADLPAAPDLGYAGYEHWATAAGIDYLVPMAESTSERISYIAPVSWTATGWTDGGAMETRQGSASFTVVVEQQPGGQWRAIELTEQQ